ncbi:MAG: dehydrogenase [Burkholderiales bacterium PBB4]|nr:MAG: dehydrogenase [Burkholderiales bacterium PBB4]
MKYLCLVYLSQEKWNACADEVCFEAAKGLQMGGHLLAAEPLHPVDTATTLRIRNGQLSMVDGPFAETKEQLAGFYLLEAADLNEAIHMAAKIPPVQHGSVEVRPVRELEVAGFQSFTPTPQGDTHALR